MKLKRLLYTAFFALMVVSCGKDDAPKPPTDTNTAPTIEGKTFMADEDIDDATVIGIVSAHDEDGDELTFTISANSDGLFKIGAIDGKLTLDSGKSLDYAAKPQHTITINVTDGTDSAQAVMTINVTEVVEVNQPPQMGDQSFEVAENIGDTDVIGTVAATDEDTLEFWIVADNSELFEIDMATGEITLKTGENLDFEMTTNYTLTVSANDKVNDLVTAQITITVTDVPEAQPNDKNAFVTTWQTTNNNESVYIGLNLDYAYDFQINWGDGNIASASANIGQAAAIFHEYVMAGTYTVSIVGDFPAIFMGFGGATPLALKSIEQWGTIQWQTMSGAFQNCETMVYNATDIPDLSQVESMVSMFSGATSFNGDIGGWELGNTVDNISGMFEGATSFNQDISGWDVSSVSFMGNLFNGASSFNQDLGNWQVLSLKNNISFTGSGMSAQNYSSTIIGWAAQDVNQNVNVFAEDINYCDDYDSIDAWNTLNDPNTNKWSVQHAGYVSCE